MLLETKRRESEVFLLLRNLLGVNESLFPMVSYHLLLDSFPVSLNVGLWEEEHGMFACMNTIIIHVYRACCEGSVCAKSVMIRSR